MREILFRGKRLDNGVWITGAYHPGGGRHFIFPLALATETAKTKVIPETVGQFTGLLDKNGKRIFEGDVVALRTGRAHIVKFEDGSFILTGTAIPIRYVNKFGIIGNIHDNPELLKEGDTDGKERTE